MEMQYNSDGTKIKRLSVEQLRTFADAIDEELNGYLEERYQVDVVKAHVTRGHTNGPELHINVMGRELVFNCELEIVSERDHGSDHAADALKIGMDDIADDVREMIYTHPSEDMSIALDEMQEKDAKMDYIAPSGPAKKMSFHFTKARFDSEDEDQNPADKEDDLFGGDELLDFGGSETRQMARESLHIQPDGPWGIKGVATMEQINRINIEIDKELGKDSREDSEEGMRNLGMID